MKDFYSLYSAPRENASRSRYFTEERIKEYWKNVDFAWGKIEQGLLEKLNDEQKAFYHNEILPFWDLQSQVKRDRNLKLDNNLIKVWIARRVFDLGYDGKLHGSFDDNRDSYMRSDHAKIERIGKKYQWIAFYEVLGILADNYKIKDRYGSDGKRRFYDGPWDITYRDIDPSFTSRMDREKYPDDDFGIVNEGNDWYMPPKYIHWNKLQRDWAETAADLPNCMDCIERTDNKGEKWLYLSSSHIWKSPKSIGQDSYVYGRKEIWYMFQSFLVPKAKYQKTIKWLLEKEFNGRWLPEAHNVSNLLARERYWSPLSKKYDKEHGLWRTLEDSSIKVMLPAEEATGDLDKDESGAHFGYKIPCKKMFDALELSYADQDGEFRDKKGEILFSNLSPLGCMIKKEALLKFLEDNDLKIVWTLLGEKDAFYRTDGGEDIRKSLSCVFTLENDEVMMKGNLKIKDW